ncbi:hypothetical protein BGW80DRAFT_373077 [Lactifluus volemus]|nr:hypothetical protein BGW80DRAFT_373077 [Lactifluus volemus]
MKNTPVYIINNTNIVSASGKFSDCPSHRTLPVSAPKSLSVFCPTCGKPCRRKQELGRHLLSFHLPLSIFCPYSLCSWRGDRTEDLQRHLRKQGCGPLNPRREQYEIYERRTILDWILIRGNAVEQVARYALGVVEERARELGKMEEWSDLWGRQGKTARRRREEQGSSPSSVMSTSFPSTSSSASTQPSMTVELPRTDAGFYWVHAADNLNVSSVLTHEY